MTKGIKIAICDDNAIIRNAVKEKCESFFISKEYKVEYELFTSGVALLSSAIIFDLVILDLEMPEMHGFEVAKKIQLKTNKSKIILLTSHQELMKHGYKVNAFRYLSKPIDDADFNEAFSSFIKDVFEKRRTIEIYIKKEKIHILQSDIVFIEALGDSMAIYTATTTYVSNDSLKAIFEKLNSPDFCYVNRNYIVNLDHVKKIEANFVILANKEKIRVSRRRIKEFKKTFHNYIISDASFFMGDDTEC